MDKGITLFNFSEEQNLFIAKGKSAEMVSTTVSDNDEAFSLKIFVDFAHTGVSRLGTIFKILYFSLNVDNDMFFKSESTSVNSGALIPILRISAFVLTVLPCNVILAINQ
jgi:hypothetical protein